MKKIFHRFAMRFSAAAGTPMAFVLALSVICIWALTGEFFDYSTSWQLVINSATTIVTFLMVFLIQNTQNRDAREMQLKLDELIRVTSKARDSFVDLEDVSDEDLQALDTEFHALRRTHDASPLLHKLHSKIKDEHQRRSSK